MLIGRVARIICVGWYQPHGLGRWGSANFWEAVGSAPWTLWLGPRGHWAGGTDMLFGLG